MAPLDRFSNHPAKAAKARQMNLWSVTALGIGAMVGAGIFAVLGQTALLAGKQTYISFILGGCVAALCGYSYAKLACRYPDAGGISTYFDEAFGAGRLSGTLSLIYLITIAATVALVAKAFGAYATPLVFADSNRIWVDIFASGLVIVLALLNVIGAGLVGKAEIFLVGFKLFILVGLMIVGAISMGHVPPTATSHSWPCRRLWRSWPDVPRLRGIRHDGECSWQRARSATHDPARDLSGDRRCDRALRGACHRCTRNVSPAQLAQHSDTAVAEAARPVWARPAYTIVSVAALLATASGVNAWIFSAMKISATLAKAGQLPRMFSKLGVAQRNHEGCLSSWPRYWLP